MAKQTIQRVADFDLESSDLEELFGYNLKRAYIIVQNDFREALGQDGLSARVFSALSLTVKYPNITQSELARMMGIERSGLVAIVDELEGRGCLSRVQVPTDRRVQALVPTDNGRRLYQETIAAVRAHEDRLFSDMTESEKTTLLALLKKIRQKGEQE
ncbi:MarR family winged helix-turn-helix transcriptional regulator [Tritonibacter horizontis]|uniref:Putative HTH-type transcriptional regulator YusO n=1 Tax=Tritonibacter horizontis TaxID=1768241 RepID=A0A132BR05_9RHOB|nr:MarR family transcriptional regulator [Tritonibacter horizontis]KUP90835.1 putative HTH-type transcriptional regulator YusO [Tritonibacter horizontis]